VIIKKIIAENFIGIKKGIKKDKLEVNFIEDGFIVISGENGSGKSVLMRLLTPYAEDKEELIDTGETNASGKPIYIPASKILFIEHQGKDYRITHTYSKLGNKKSFFTDISGDEEVELNPNGNYTSFKEVAENILGISESTYKRMIITNTALNSFLDLSSTERKKNLLNDVEVQEYIDYYNKAVEIRKADKRQIEYMMKLINDIGDEKELNNSIKTLEEKINALANQKIELEKKLEKTNGELAVITSRIQDILPDNTEFNSYISSLKNERLAKERQLNTLIDQAKKLNIETESINSVLEEKNKTLQAYKDYLYALQNKLSEAYEKAQEQNNIKNLIQEVSQINAHIKHFDNEIERCNEAIKKLTEDFGSSDEKDAIDAAEHKIVYYSKVQSKLEDFLNQLQPVYSVISNLTKEQIDVLNNPNIYVSLSEQEQRLRKKLETNSSLSNVLNIIVSDKEICNSICTKEECHNRFNEMHNKILENSPDNTESIDFLKNELEKISERVREFSLVYKFYNSTYKNIKPLESEINNFIKEVWGVNAFSFQMDNKESYTLLYNALNTVRDVINKETRNKEAYIQFGKQLADYNNQIRRFETEKAKYAEQLEEKKNAILELLNGKTAEQLQVEIEEVQKTIKETKELITKTERSIDYTSKEISVIESLRELDAIKERIEHIDSELEKLQELGSKYETTYELSTTYNNNLKEIENYISSYNDEIYSIKAKINNKKEYLDNYNKLVKDYNLLEDIIFALHPTKGIPSKLVNEILYRLEASCNHIFSKYFNEKFSINFINNEKELDVLVTSTYSGITSRYDNMSAGERSIVKLALSIAISLEKLESRLGAIFMDEIDSFLDADNRNSFELLLDSLKSDYNIQQVFIISHNVDLRGQQIVFDKSGGSVSVSINT
jgi:DNA repair exonuclease SbcCD ATPase subunit